MGGYVFQIQDERELGAKIKRALERDGLRVQDCASIEAVQSALGTKAPSVVLLPWSGEAALRRALWDLKGSGPLTPSVILLAPHAKLSAAIASLCYGVDDCVGVPFLSEELVARVAAALERPPIAAAPERLEAGPVVLDKAEHALTVSGQNVSLAPTEFRLLSFFLEHQGRVFSRSQLLQGAWARHVAAGPRTVDVHVRRLRQLLEPFGCDDMIQTVRGFGYRFTGRPVGDGASRPERMPARRPYLTTRSGGI